jgi:hypothetical protein
MRPDTPSGREVLQGPGNPGFAARSVTGRHMAMLRHTFSLLTEAMTDLHAQGAISDEDLEICEYARDRLVTTLELGVIRLQVRHPLNQSEAFERLRDKGVCCDG